MNDEVMESCKELEDFKDLKDFKDFKDLENNKQETGNRPWSFPGPEKTRRQ
jgi:hypothetical protein